MAEEENVNVRVYIKRNLWAPVKALATEKNMSVDEALEMILAEFLKMKPVRGI